MKSVARIWSACWRTNSRQVRWLRRGAGSRPWRRSTFADGEVGTAVAQLAQLAHDPPVAPAFVLHRQLENEVVQLAPDRRPLPAAAGGVVADKWPTCGGSIPDASGAGSRVGAGAIASPAWARHD